MPNYYTGEMLTIPLDETLSPLDNAKKYFARYNKLKRTFEALNTQTEETKTEIAHLQTIQAALAIAESEDDLAQIRDELETYGYIRRKMNGKKKQKFKSKPFHYRSSDGFDIYVGKIISRMTNLLSRLPTEMTGGSTPKECPAPMLL